MITHPAYIDPNGALLQFPDGPVPIRTPQEHLKAWIENISIGLGWVFAVGSPFQNPFVALWPANGFQDSPYNPYSLIRTWERGRVVGFNLKPEGGRTDLAVYDLRVDVRWGLRMEHGDRPDVYQHYISVHPSAGDPFGPLLELALQAIPGFGV